MIILKLSPVIISLLILGAHFYRASLFPFLLYSIILSFLLYKKNNWVARSIQLFLIIGSMEWIRTLIVFIDTRITIGQSWTRLAVILGSVALFTGLSALIFQIRTVKKAYQLEKLW